VSLLYIEKSVQKNAGISCPLLYHCAAKVGKNARSRPRQPQVVEKTEIQHTICYSIRKASDRSLFEEDTFVS